MLQSIGLARIGFGDVVRAHKRACESSRRLERLKRRYRQETAGARGIHVVLLDGLIRCSPGG